MIPSRPHARIVVRARDENLRSLILERLAGLGELSEERDGAQSDSSGTDAVVEAWDADPGLTPREVQVLGLLAEGLANKEIAYQLGFSTHTAKFHVESLLKKLHAANRAEAVREGIRLGLIGV
ncbi:MAG TPA: helix-turn-helix transcriptional regulator [Spirochaetia bacterium]|nr:helix-turn-helix transcriptional regulator [Spirochaetia bacterium]